MANRAPVKVKHAKKLAATQVIPFTRQLASMLGAGMTILAAIETLEEQCDDVDFKGVLRHLSEVIDASICSRPVISTYLRNCPLGLMLRLSERYTHDYKTTVNRYKLNHSGLLVLDAMRKEQHNVPLYLLEE